MKYNKEDVSNKLNAAQDAMEAMANYIDFLEKELRKYKKCIETGNALVDCSEETPKEIQ